MGVNWKMYMEKKADQRGGETASNKVQLVSTIRIRYQERLS